MSERVAVVWDDALAAYDFGPSHPLAPVRVELAYRLAGDLGLLQGPHCEVVPPAGCDDTLLELVHSPHYIAAVRRAGADPMGAADSAHGLGSEDNPVFFGMHEASAAVVGATVEGMRRVWTGVNDHAVNIAGGLHHAMPGHASGFCVYNDVSVAIAWALAQGAERIAYVDVDVHHGDGVERAFWDDPRVLTISLHETPRTLFPMTGYPEEIGGPAAEGYAVNAALPPGTEDEGWMRAFDAIVPPLLAEFRPQVLVSQQGADGHFLDPLAHLALSIDGQRAAYAALHDLAHEHAGGRWLALGGGGYEIVDVVPRAWAHLIGIAVGKPVPPFTALPETWREYVRSRLGRVAPVHMTDGRQPRPRPWSAGYDPANWLDRAILSTRRAVFPHHGLDPHFG